MSQLFNSKLLSTSQSHTMKLKPMEIWLSSTVISTLMDFLFGTNCPKDLSSIRPLRLCWRWETNLQENSSLRLSPISATTICSKTKMLSLSQFSGSYQSTRQTWSTLIKTWAWILQLNSSIGFKLFKRRKDLTSTTWSRPTTIRKVST